MRCLNINSISLMNMMFKTKSKQDLSLQTTETFKFIYWIHSKNTQCLFTFILYYISKVQTFNMSLTSNLFWISFKWLKILLWVQLEVLFKDLTEVKGLRWYEFREHKKHFYTRFSAILEYTFKKGKNFLRMPRN